MSTLYFVFVVFAGNGDDAPGAGAGAGAGGGATGRIATLATSVRGGLYGVNRHSVITSMPLFFLETGPAKVPSEPAASVCGGRSGANSPHCCDLHVSIVCHSQVFSKAYPP